VMCLALVSVSPSFAEAGQPYSGRMRELMIQLLQMDAARIRPIATPATEFSGQVEQDVVMLAPFVVEEERVRELPPAPNSQPMQDAIRTGTIAQKVGPRVTTRLGAVGDNRFIRAGVTFSW
jgi:hypothetical protein